MVFNYIWWLSMKLRDALNMGMAVVVGAAVYWLLTSRPLPLFLTLDARYGVIFPCLFALLYGICCRYAGRYEPAVSFMLICVLFALPLNVLWRLGISDGSLVGGFIPYSDAQSYYLDARRLLQGDHFSGFSTRRPLFASYLASLLFLTGDNLRLTVALLPLMSASAVFLATLQVRKRLGLASSALFLFVVFIFYRRYIGTTLTEHLGIAFGSLGLACLLEALHDRRYLPWLMGLFLLTVALCARAGLFLVLPLLLCWGAYHFRAKGKNGFRLLVSGSLAIAAGFVLNTVMVRMTGDPAGGSFSNFAYTLYGIVNDSNWYLAVQNPPPETKGLTGKAFTDMLYTLSFRAIADDPMLLVKGALKAIKYYIYGGAFHFMYHGDVPLVSARYWLENRLHAVFMENKILLGSLHIILFYSMGLISLLKNSKKDALDSRLLWFIGAGFVISIPFAPPWDADYGRAYAATMPLLALILAYGIKTAGAETGMLSDNSDDHILDMRAMQRGTNTHLLHATAVVFLLLSVVVPIYLRTTSMPVKRLVVKTDGCAQPVFLDLKKETYFQLQKDGLSPMMAPFLPVSDFRWNMGELRDAYPKFAKELHDLHIKDLLILADSRYVRIEREMISSGAGWYCARPVQGSGLMFAAEPMHTGEDPKE